MASQSNISDPGQGRPPVGRAAPAAQSASSDPEVLAAEIEKTREDLAETLDAIADKVSPKRVTQRAKKKVADAARTGAADASDAVKDKAAGAGDSVKEAVGSVKEKAVGAVASLKDSGKGDAGPGPGPGSGDDDDDGSVSALSGPSGAPGPAMHPVAVASATEPVPAKPGSLVNAADSGQGPLEPAGPTSSAPPTTPYRPVPLDPPPSRLPMMAGAAAAVAVVLLLLRRRRR